MKILLTGASGQLGYQLERSLQGIGEVVAVDSAHMDLADLDQVRAVLRAVRPGLIVNPAAYTAVDQAEAEPELAHRINALAPAVMAEEARALGAAMVHYSTDYVFDGSKAGPYVETDPTAPLNVYGQSKLAGEQAVAAAGIPHLILRTSWLYGLRGKNFLRTMLNQGKKKSALRVVSSQHGTPTWSRTVADTSALILSQARAGGPGWWQQHGGIYHLSGRGQTSWAGFAEEIMRVAEIDCVITPVDTEDIARAARRPANSVLCCDKLIARFCELPEWRSALSLCLT